MRHPLDRKSFIGGTSDNCKQATTFSETNNKKIKNDLQVNKT